MKIWVGNVKVSNGRKYLVRENGVDGALLFSYARLQLNSLTLPVLKANRARTAQPLREEPFSARTRGKNKAMDTGVATTSNTHKLPQNSAQGFEQTAATATRIFCAENTYINNWVYHTVGSDWHLIFLSGTHLVAFSDPFVLFIYVKLNCIWNKKLNI